MEDDLKGEKETLKKYNEGTSIQTSDDYLEFVKNYLFLLEIELSKVEDLKNKGKDVASALPLLLSLVNTVEAFRGQNGYFLNFRDGLLGAHNPAIQNELRNYENIYVSRIDTLIEKVLKDEKLKENFNFQYFGRIYLDRGFKKHLNYKILTDKKESTFTLKNMLMGFFVLIFLGLSLYRVLYL